MLKNKYLIIPVVLIAILGLAGGGWFIWQRQNSSQLKRSPASVQGTNTSQTLTQTNDPNSISLNQTRSAPNSTGGLSVAPSSSGQNLGQLTPNSSGTSSSGAGSDKSAASILDPSTFAQYDKYKPDKGALFGEVQPGTGNELTEGKKAAVYYKGWLTSGQMFDMSRAGNDGKLEPFIFTMGEHKVIPGWEQALYGMKAGGVRLLIVPPAVGYGEAGQGPIPGNAVLIFQVQLLEVQ